ncbi:glucose 1-dehydrogenase [candidate division KSB3 bacterium]|uniref:Glucose 1-dehydrogenase n=1 Tax=candidate division KSB3 bacterium TaxID=2044937 RepID=A0A9D5Q537_9BACT|nr:glucose 1-dehydrogenase [candidate division KSB3 bacterium]MBD3324180.1 glucose 1-dehydrogenase [candidate division KSB3 bacterium]
MEYDVNSMFGIAGDVAIITGAAGGIGKEVARGMASIGVKVVIADISATEMGLTVEELKGEGLEVIGIQTDVTDEESVQAMAAEVAKQFGRIDILVNCAGVLYFQETVEFDIEKWQWLMDINVKGTFLTCKAAGKYMLQQKKGRIVNFSSVRGLQGKERYAAYAPSKGAVNLMTKSLAIEWAKDNINVNAVAPVFTLTELSKKILDDERQYNWVISRLPKGRLCEPQWLVGPVIFLCSPCSDFVTGHILYVDGGWTAA